MSKNIYEFNIKKIKARIKSLRFNPDGTKKLTQEKVAEGIHIETGTSRTAITNWENPELTTLPDLKTLVDLCNYFKTDIDYILGRTNIKSTDTKIIAETLNLSEESIEILREKSECGTLINSIISDVLFLEIVQRTKQLSYSLMLKDIISTSFVETFAIKIQQKFNDYYSTIFPIDMSQSSFREYLFKNMPYSKNFNSNQFLESNFLEDGKNFVYNQAENFLSQSNLKQYDLIISSIAEITYDYFLSLKTIELSKHKLDIMLSEILDNAIKKEADTIKHKTTEMIKTQ